MMKLIDEAKENAFQTIENEAIYLLSNFRMTEEGNQSITGFGLDVADYKVQLLEFGKALDRVENDVENFNEHDRERVDALRALARLATAYYDFKSRNERLMKILEETRDRVATLRDNFESAQAYISDIENDADYLDDNLNDFEEEIEDKTLETI